MPHVAPRRGRADVAPTAVAATAVSGGDAAPPGAGASLRELAADAWDDWSTRLELPLIFRAAAALFALLQFALMAGARWNAYSQRQTLRVEALQLPPGLNLTLASAEGTPLGGVANASAAAASLARQLQLQAAVSIVADVRREGGSYADVHAFQFLVGAGVITWLYSLAMLGPEVFAYVAANPEADVSRRAARLCAVVTPRLPAIAAYCDALLAGLEFAAANAAAGVASQLRDCGARRHFCSLARAATAMAFFATVCLVPTHRAAARARRRQRASIQAARDAAVPPAGGAVEVSPATTAPLTLPPPLASPRGVQMT